MTNLLKEETPAYRIASKGTASLADVELLSVIISTGETGKASSDALRGARTLLESVDNSLHDLGKLSLYDMQQLGLTSAQANRVVAAFEIGRRRAISDIRTRKKIASSRDAYNCMSTIIADLHHEEFWILLLNKAYEVIGRKQMTIGGTCGTVADVKLIFKAALESRASAFVAFHNHPSGNLKPSEADIQLTKKLKEVGSMMDLPMVDHLIISERGYYSFADEGVI